MAGRCLSSFGLHEGSFGSTPAVWEAWSERPLSDLQAAIASGSEERPLMADFSRLRG